MRKDGSPADQRVPVSTYFAPGERSQPDQLENDRAALAANMGAMAGCFDSVPLPMIITNQFRDIVFANKAFREAAGSANRNLIGLRAGEALNCIHHQDGPSGCGTSKACSQCGAVLAMTESMATNSRVERECHLTCRDGAFTHASEFQVVGSPVCVGDRQLTSAVFRDISSEKRKAILERTFLHDILNTVGSVQGLAALMSDAEPQEISEYASLIGKAATQAVDEIGHHRTLTEAENGTLSLNLTDVHVPTMVDDLCVVVRHHPIASGRKLIRREMPDVTVRTDEVLLRRVLGNLLKNALEATSVGGTASIWCEQGENGLNFHVHNPAVMPEAVQLQIFHRSFSTKGRAGRGIGTWSVKLFGERYLKGRVSFLSTSEQGTIFSFFLPT